MTLWANIGLHNQTEPFIKEILQIVGFYYKFRYLLQVFQIGQKSLNMTLIDFGNLQMYFKLESDQSVLESYQRLVEKTD